MYFYFLKISQYYRRQKWRDILMHKIPKDQRGDYHEAYMKKSFLDCHEWEDDMNKIIKENSKTKQARIYVENWVDEEGRPKKFKVKWKNSTF